MKHRYVFPLILALIVSAIVGIDGARNHPWAQSSESLDGVFISLTHENGCNNGTYFKVAVAGSSFRMAQLKTKYTPLLTFEGTIQDNSLQGIVTYYWHWKSGSEIAEHPFSGSLSHDKRTVTLAYMASIHGCDNCPMDLGRVTCVFQRS